MLQRTALIFGVSGQDGAYMAASLLARGYAVHGTSRDHVSNPFSNLIRLGIFGRVQLYSVAIEDFRSVFGILAKVKPQEIYHLGGQTSVGLSFEQPVESFESITISTLNVLECMRLTAPVARFFNPASSEIFGNAVEPATIDTPFRPRSPYAMAKAAAYWATVNYREAYNLFAVNGVLFNHESPLRGERFVTRKIIKSAVAVHLGRETKLRLGNIRVVRDWGWAPDMVEASIKSLQRETPDDYIMATGESHSLEEFVAAAFAQLGLDWKIHTEIDTSLFRPTDLEVSRARPERTKQQLDWQPKKSFKQVIEALIADELQVQTGRAAS